MGADFRKPLHVILSDTGICKVDAVKPKKKTVRKQEGSWSDVPEAEGSWSDVPEAGDKGRRHRTLQAMQTGTRQAEEGGLPTFCLHCFFSKKSAQDFPDGPVVGTLPSNAGGVSSSSV